MDIKSMTDEELSVLGWSVWVEQQERSGVVARCLELLQSLEYAEDAVADSLTSHTSPITKYADKHGE